ncbi:MAG: hypothetical protein RL180_401 [Pseudomonadota bacterium]
MMSAPILPMQSADPASVDLIVAIAAVQPVYTREQQAWMAHALALAKQAAASGEVPVGAVLVHHGQIIGEGFNQPILSHDPTAHAEIVAIRDACQRLNNYRLPDDTVLYVTLEPCTQCVGALVHARVAQVIYAAAEPRAGSLVSARQLMQQGYYNHYFAYSGGLLADESSQVLRDFFKQRRQNAKRQSESMP